MIYLDYQATTPLAPEARAAMWPLLDTMFGNPHSPHRMGREARALVEVARGEIAVGLGGGHEAGALWFTSGATEAVNWALKGAMGGTRKRIVTIATEHACVLDTAEALARAGADLVVLPVDAEGLVDLDAARAAITPDTAIVAAMLVNNEIGVIQPIAELGAMARAAGALMFCDAVQGYGRVPLPIAYCDLVALSAHKIHGPKGIGALWMRRGVTLQPLLHGGGQEGGVRSGTLAPALCVGFGAAARLMVERREADGARVAMLRDQLIAGLGEGWTINGSMHRRYAGNLNLRRRRLDAGRLISQLRGIAFSAGSACASGSGRPSHVLGAIGLDTAEARSSIRLGFGRYTTIEEIDAAAEAINAAIAQQGVFA